MRPSNNSIQKGVTLWFTGLPCAGKTTLARAVAKKLKSSGLLVEHLDGDALRRTFSRNLGFSKEDRLTHVKRVAYVAALLTRSNIITLVSLISPYRQMRKTARQMIGKFIEIYVRCPLAVCEKRDVKGMYRLARKGRIKNFTGISDIYEEPLNPDILVDTQASHPQACVRNIIDSLERGEWILPRRHFEKSLSKTNQI